MDLSDTGIQHHTDSAVLAHYTGDESSAFHGHASAVVLPRNVDEVAEVIRRAAASRTPVTLSGAGTSITGARVPDGGIVLGTERLRRWPDIVEPAGADCPPPGSESIAASAERFADGEWGELAGADYRIALAADAMSALVPAGVRLSELDRLLASRNLLYPPDPTEMTAMIGGTIATNASGSRSYRFGATRDWVDGLLVVTASGSVVAVRRGEYVAEAGILTLPKGFPSSSVEIPAGITMPRTKHAAGFHVHPSVDLVDLLVGSEGTLGVVVAAQIRLIPRPDPLFQLAAFYESPEAAFAAADAVRCEPDVLAIEYFDGRSLSFIRSSYPTTPDAAACVLFESHYEARGRHNPYPREELIDRWATVVRATRAVADWVATGEELRGMRSFRHALPEAINRWVAARVGKLGTDMAVPAPRFARMHEHYRRAQDAGILSALFGHLGQYHLHLNFLPADEAELREARAVYRELARTAVSLGGSISAEHGVGKKQLLDEEGVGRPYLYYQFGETGVRAMECVKAAFDPDWILNPGTMLPRP